MDPLTLLAIAQVAVSGVQLVQNYFEGQSQISKAKKKQSDAYALQTEGIDQQAKSVEQQFTQGQQDIEQAGGNEAASLAARGIQGGYVNLALGANRTDRVNKLNTWNDNATAGINLARKNAAMGNANALDQLQEQQDQLNMNAITGGIGVGLSAAGTLVKAGVFKDTGSNPFDIQPGSQGNFLEDYSFTGGRQTKMNPTRYKSAVAF
jgi:hypothetical protein